jgi:hypothetical protein
MQQPHGGNRKVNNVNLDDKPEGNSARQALRKLRDGAPELHAKVLDLLDRALKREPGRPEKSDNVRHKDETAHKAGNSSPYALRKLRDGAPELHARVRTRTSAAWHRGVEHVPGADAGRVWQSRLE